MQGEYCVMKKNFYVNLELDRSGHLRTDTNEIQAMLDNGEATILPVWRAQSFISNAQTSPRLADIPNILAKEVLEDAKAVSFLGLLNGVPHFAIDLSHHETPPLDKHGEFFDLREVGPAMSAEEGAIAAFARGITHWHAHHKYCGKCGSPTKNMDAGHRRRCLNAECSKDHFPRTDPAVIMLVEDDQGRALLGRSPNFKEGMYSTLAGFVEPGESLEQAVSREVFEEVGVHVSDIKYHSSQPWPFPSSLMLGYTAKATTTDITIDPNEIEDARWFTREGLLSGEASGTCLTPRKDSISWVLISDWLNRA